MSKYIFESLISNADKIVAGFFIGLTALTIVNLLLPIMLIFIGIIMMFISGLNVQLNYWIGNNQHKKAEESMTGTIIIVSIFATIMITTLFLFKKEIFYLMSIPKESLEIANIYYPFLILSLGGFGLGYTMDCAIIADRNPKFSAFLMISSAIVNLGLNIVLVVFFKLGALGLGIATLSSSLVMASMSIGYFIFGFNKKFKLRKPVFDLKEIIGIIYNGSSELFTIGCEAITLLVTNIVIMKYLGVKYLETFAIVSLVSSIIISTSIGGVAGSIPMISESLGKGNLTKANSIYEYVSKKTIKISIIVYILCYPLLYLMTNILGVQTDFTMMYLSYGLGETLVCFSVGTTMYFTAIKRPLESIISGVIRSGVVIPGCIFIFVALFKEVGIGIAFIVGDGILIFIFNKVRRSKNHSLKKDKKLNYI